MAANAVHALPREVPFRVEVIRLKTITTAPREDVAELVAKRACSSAASQGRLLHHPILFHAELGFSAVRRLAHRDVIFVEPP
jgi:hypothetical protein